MGAGDVIDFGAVLSNVVENGTTLSFTANGTNYTYSLAGVQANTQFTSQGDGSGGTALSLIEPVSAGQTLIVSGGQTSAGLVTSGGFGPSASQIIVSSGGAAIGTVVGSGGTQNVWGVAVGTVVSGLGGYENVDSGAVAIGRAVSYDMLIDSGGIASGTVVSSGGTEYVEGGIASGTVVSSGGTEYVEGGIASGTVVSSGGFQYVYGGVAVGTTVLTGGTEIVDGFSAVASATIIAGGTEILSGGALPQSVMFLGSGGTLDLVDVSFSPVLQGTISGWQAGDVIDFGAVLSRVVDNGTTLSFTIGGRTIKYSLAGIEANTQLASHGDGSGGTALSLIVPVSAGQTLVVSPGQTSAGLVDLGGTIDVLWRGATVDAVLSSGGGEYVSSGGVASGTVLSSGGTEIVSSGGVASGTVISNGGTEIVSAGASANGITFAGSGGELILAAPGEFTGTMSGWQVGDVIDFQNATLSNIVESGATLSFSAGGQSYSYDLAGAQADTYFTSQSDGSGGVLLGSVLVASASVTPTSLVFGNHHVGDSSGISQSLTVTNTAPTGSVETLDAAAGATTGGATDSGSASLIAPGASSMALTTGIDTSTAGTKNGTATIDLASDGAGPSGMQSVTLPAQTINVTGAVYRYAAAQPTLSLPAEIHVGQTVNLSIANTAATDGFSENLDGSVVSGLTGVSTSGSISGLAAGSSSNAISLTFNQAATVSGNLGIDFESDGGAGGGSIDGLGTTDLGITDVAVSAVVDNYAAATIEVISGRLGSGLPAPFSWNVSGNAYTINLAVVEGSGPITFDLGVLNAATGPADLLEGSFDAASSSAFQLSGFDDFAGIAAGQADAAPTVTFSTSSLGTFAETITLNPTGYNGSGYSGDLAPETLTINGTVVAPPPAIWQGPSARNHSGEFDTASNWNGGLVPGTTNKASINAAGTYTVSSDEDHTVGSMVIADPDATLEIGAGRYFGIADTAASSNAGTILLDDGATLHLADTITNNGMIAAPGGGYIQIAGTVILKGAGTVSLGSGAEITDAGFTGTLVNQSTIAGAGAISAAGSLALTNAWMGVIDADGSAAALTISVTGAVRNAGLIEATGAGGLIIAGGVSNTGTLAADGGTLQVTGAVAGAGQATIANGSTLEFDSTVAKAQTVTFASASTGMLLLQSAAGFAGTVAGLASGDAIDLADLSFGSAKIAGVTGTGAAGTDTVIRVTAGTVTAKIALLNQFANEFAVSKGAYTLASDQHGSTPGTLLELATPRTG